MTHRPFLGSCQDSLTPAVCPGALPSPAGPFPVSTLLPLGQPLVRGLSDMWGGQIIQGLSRAYPALPSPAAGEQGLGVGEELQADGAPPTQATPR